MAKVIGIDLGTTNSCVAVMEGGDTKVIENSEGARTTPSMVAFTDGGERLVGQAAKRQAVTNPMKTLYSVKRLIGRRFDDPMVAKEMSLVPFKIVKASNGDTFLGGEDFDLRVISYLADEFKKEQGIDLRNDKLALQRLKEAAEKAKIELSNAKETEINLPFITADASGPKHLVIKLSRAKLEPLVDELIQRTLKPCKARLKDAGLQAGQIDEVILVGIPPAPRGMPQVEVTFDIDANGIVQVSAKDKATGKEQQIRIQASGGLSEADIQKMVKDAELHAEEDKKKRELIDARNQGEALVHSTDKHLKEIGDKVSRTEKAAIEGALEALKSTLTGENAEEIKTKTNDLAQAAMKLGEAMYKAQQAEAQPGPAASGAGEPGGAANEAKGEHVVDAECEGVTDKNKKTGSG